MKDNSIGPTPRIDIPRQPGQELPQRTRRRPHRADCQERADEQHDVAVSKVPDRGFGPVSGLSWTLGPPRGTLACKALG